MGTKRSETQIAHHIQPITRGKVGPVSIWTPTVRGSGEAGTLSAVSWKEQR